MRTDRIEINPQVMSGKPVIRGTRIPVELLVRKLSEGATEVVILTLNDSRPGTKARGAVTWSIYCGSAGLYSYSSKP